MENDFMELGNLIADVINGFENNVSNKSIEHSVKNKITDICKKYPIY